MLVLIADGEPIAKEDPSLDKDILAPKKSLSLSNPNSLQIESDSIHSKFGTYVGNDDGKDDGSIDTDGNVDVDGVDEGVMLPLGILLIEGDDDNCVLGLVDGSIDCVGDEDIDGADEGVMLLLGILLILGEKDEFKLGAVDGAMD